MFGIGSLSRLPLTRSEQTVFAFTVIGAHRGKITVSAERRANVKGGDVRFTPESGHKRRERLMSACDPKRTLRQAALDVRK